ncbi:MAG: peptidoglycan DD-metalloendopeptidase family protein [Marinilabiliaceae bacterium]|jgi:murein DD-endopeptidase MepM/ murein hydrolase activator NlpD|nr:peptidoglycan DD-metalloendopeptidase family protein [Marinilabiliaceae bacterium]
MNDGRGDGMLFLRDSESMEILPGLREMKIFHLDLGPANKSLKDLDLTDNLVFKGYLEGMREEFGFDIAAGGYNEERILYSRSSHFGTGENVRTIHLGVDLWTEKGSDICAPLDGIVHSLANNTAYRDYGPTIILEHSISNIKLYTLYGHLSSDSLEENYQGKTVGAGEVFARVGSEDVNGNWPPHVHFQLIRDMGAYSGDYPGVASKKDREKFLFLCPDPNLILGLDILNKK